MVWTMLPSRSKATLRRLAEFSPLRRSFLLSRLLSSVLPLPDETLSPSSLFRLRMDRVSVVGMAMDAGGDNVDGLVAMGAMMSRSGCRQAWPHWEVRSC